jgi:hypothetical protein
MESRRRGIDLAAFLARDEGLTATVALTLCLSVLSMAYFIHSDLVTAYGDGQARLLIARTVLGGRHPGLAQLGGIWPPFPQAYMLPFVWSNALYYSGIAGAVPSALSYLWASAFLYKLVARMTRDQVAGLVAVVAFSGPNTLFLQSVPMSELPFIACFVTAVYFIVRWLLDGSLGALFLAGLFGCLATLTRYEGWVLVGLLAGVVVLACWQGLRQYQEVEGHLVFFGLVAFFGIALWLVWNRVILGDTLYFLHSQYGAKAINGLQLMDMAPPNRPTGSLQLSALVTGWTVLDNLGVVGAGVALLGLARLALGPRPGPAVTAALLLLFPIAFSVLAVYAGAEVVGDAHATPGEAGTNLRYGLLLAPAAGFLAGWLAQGRRLRWPVLSACVASSLLVWHGGPVDAGEAAGMTKHYSEASQPAGDWLREHYDGGLVLMQRRTNENLLFTSRVPVGQVVYEGDRDEWTRDLADPAREVHWIVMDSGTPSEATPPDDIWKSLHDRPALVDRYQLVYDSGPIHVYRLGGS